MADAGVVIDWDEDGFDTGDFDDVTGDVLGWTFRRGAGPRIIDAAQQGFATITLDNRSGRYNPLNTGGTLFGTLTDGLPLHISVNVDGAATGTAARGAFAGRTLDITPQPTAAGVPTVEITAEDALGWYRRLPARVADAEGRSHGALREAMLDAAGETLYTLQPEIETMPLSAWESDLLAGLDAINGATGSRHFCDPADDRADWYTYRAFNRMHRLAGVAQGTVTGSDFQTSGWTLSADTVTNQQKATVVPITFTPSSNVVWQATTEDLPYTIGSAQSRTVWVDFDDYVGDPVVEMDYTGGTAAAVITPFGDTAKIVITTSSGTATVTGLEVTGRLARRAVAQSVVIDDTASQAGSRGVRAGPDISGDFVGGPASAAGIASHIVWRYATPQFRPQLVVTNTPTLQLGVDLYDVLSLTSTALGMTSRLFEIVGREDRYVPKQHVTTFNLQECRVQSATSWFVADTSTADGSHILGY